MCDIWILSFLVLYLLSVAMVSPFLIECVVFPVSFVGRFFLNVGI